jgi:hypothetical protein
MSHSIQREEPEKLFYTLKNCFKERKHPNHPTNMLHSIIKKIIPGERNLMLKRLNEKPCSTLEETYMKVINNTKRPINPPSAP